jgi:hypothetical protein
LCNLAKAHTTDVMVFKYVDSEKSANW